MHHLDDDGFVDFDADHVAVDDSDPAFGRPAEEPPSEAEMNEMAFVDGVMSQVPVDTNGELEAGRFVRHDGFEVSMVHLGDHHYQWTVSWTVADGYRMFTASGRAERAGAAWRRGAVDAARTAAGVRRLDVLDRFAG